MILASFFSKKHKKHKKNGFVLIAVLWITAMLSVMAMNYATGARIDALGILNIHKQQQRFFTRQAGIILGEHEYEKYKSNKSLLDKKEELEAETDDKLILWYPRYEVYNSTINSEPVYIRIFGEAGRVNINSASKDFVDKALSACGVEEKDLSKIRDVILDWTDSDQNHHLNGAENDYYEKETERPYLCKDAPIENIEELLLLKGINSDLYHGNSSSPGLIDFFDVWGTGNKIDVNSASPNAFKLLGNATLSDEDISKIIEKRQEVPVKKMADLLEIIPPEATSEFNKYFGIISSKQILIQSGSSKPLELGQGLMVIYGQ